MRDKSRNNHHGHYRTRSDAAIAAEKLEAAAFALAESAHRGQMYGDRPYMYHLEMVCEAVYPCDVDGVASLAARRAVALLHDVIEDTSITCEKVAEVCGQEVSDIVWELTSRPEEAGDKSRNLEFARLAGMSLSAKIVKVADLASNMRCCAEDNSPYLAGYVAAWPRYKDALAEAFRLDDNALDSIELCIRVYNEPERKWRPVIQHRGLVYNISSEV